jgi:hypothetical protein
MSADLEPVSGAASQSRLSVRIVDANNAAGAGIPVTVEVRGGKVEMPTIISDEDGIARFTITWSDATGSIIARSPSLASIKVAYPAVVPPANPASSVTTSPGLTMEVTPTENANKK